MHGDPVADMLTRIRNGYRARLDKIKLPRSKMAIRICEILREEGFISGLSEASVDGARGVLDVELKYGAKGLSAISGLQRMSKLSLRQYFSTKNIPRVRSGLGIVIMSTSKGVMTDRKARKLGVGGEAVCKVW